MKIQTTYKAIRKEYGKNILRVGYCDLQYLLRYENPFAYSAGVYGWNCDYYDIGGVCISTGYRPIGEHVPYELTRRFEEQAEEWVVNWNVDFEVKKTRLANLVEEFIREATKEG